MTSASLSQTAKPAPAFPALRLDVSDLGLSRGDTVLASDLALALGPGEAVLLTGRNGTGKTSLLRALAGFIAPDAGSIMFNDAPPAIAAADSIAWLGHADGLKPGETPRSALRFWADLYGQPRTAIMPGLRALEIDHLIVASKDAVASPASCWPIARSGGSTNPPARSTLKAAPAWRRW